METGIPIWKWGLSGKIMISCPKFGGRYSSMRDLEVAKNTLPISRWGVPVRKWAGRVEYSHMGSPRFRIEFVSIWGLTYIYILIILLGFLYTKLVNFGEPRKLNEKTQD
jgi:hypothetical protein